MTLNEATAANLRRKAEFIDNVQFYKGIPLFSWVDLNLTELCNRRCVFCPRVDPKIYPNRNLHMSAALSEKMAKELRFLNFKGTVVLCGFGEPLLHPNISVIVSHFGNRGIRVEIVTNGDHLTIPMISRLTSSGVQFFAVSMYDGPEQIKKFQTMFSESGVDKSHYILRDRWYGPSEDYGLKLTNRAGMIEVGNQNVVDLTRPCYYPSYCLVVDWNGDILLCVQDWSKQAKIGNITTESMFNVWTNPEMMRFRTRLANGNRCQRPCNKCNAEGTLHGVRHTKEWGFIK